MQAKGIPPLYNKMGGDTGTKSGTGSGYYRAGHGYQGHKTTFKSTIPGIVDSV